MHATSTHVVVDAPTADYHPSTFETWIDERQRRCIYAQDHWFYVYRGAPGDTIVDVGAGKGEDITLFSQAVGESGKVIAIEAHPAMFCCLRMFCQLNKFENVTPIHAAIADRRGLVELGTAQEWQATSLFTTPADTGRIAVPGFTLDELLEEHGLRKIDFLKMNIEGAEALALQGMERVLRMTRTICIACHDFRAEQGESEFFRTKSQVERVLREAGFNIIDRKDPRPFIADQVNAVK